MGDKYDLLLQHVFVIIEAHLHKFLLSLWDLYNKLCSISTPHFYIFLNKTNTGNQI